MNGCPAADRFASPPRRGRVLAVAALAALTIHAAVLFGFTFPGIRSLPLAADQDTGIVISLAVVPSPAASAPATPPAPEETRRVPSETPPPVVADDPDASVKRTEPTLPVNRSRQRHRRKEASAAQAVPASTASLPAAVTPAPSPRGESLSPPEPLGQAYNPKPVYPEVARRRGQQGTVRLLVRVGADGAVQSLDVQRSSGHAMLDDAALKAVRRWRFKPARIGGGVVAGEVVVPVEFRLR